MNIPDEERRIGSAKPSHREALVTVLSTPGPWRWQGYASVHKLHLATKRWGHHFVMDFVRWGMRQAQPRFQDRERHLMVDAQHLLLKDRDSTQVHGINNPDAILLERAPEILRALLVVAFAVTPEDDVNARNAAADLALELERLGVIKIERTP